MQVKIVHSNFRGWVLLALLTFLTVKMQGQIISTYAGSGTSSGSSSGSFSGDGGPATAATMNNPVTFVFDSHGNIYIADAFNHRIRQVDITTGIISTFAGNGSAGFSGDGGPATAAQLNTPAGVAIDASDNIYISDWYNNRVRIVNAATGIISTFAGNGSAGFSGDGGLATAASINQAGRVYVDVSGNVYVSDRINFRIRKINTSGVITTFAGNGSVGFSGDGGPATAATMQTPFAITGDPAGNIYFADLANNRIRKISTSGIITTMAGNGTFGFSGDGGAATSAAIAGAYGVWYHGGYIFIGTNGDNRIRAVSPTGKILTYAGNGSGGFSGDGGLATAAALNQLSGVGISQNYLWIADQYNNRVRRVNNSAPSFLHALSDTITICSTSAGISLDTQMAVLDSNSSQLLTWQIITNPLHGTLTGFPASIGANTAVVFPTSFSFIPTTGYTGYDSFTVSVTDGILSDTTKVYVFFMSPPVPGAITGPSTVCVSNTITLADTSAGGTWSVTPSSVATISTTGTLYGIAVGAATVTYTTSNSCGPGYVTFSVAVITLPSAGTISGSSTVCVGASTPISSTVSGGTWTSSDTSIATINSTGSVTGVAAGAVTMSYAVTNSCGTTTITYNMTVNPLPVSGLVSGPVLNCVTGTITLTSTATGGTWATSNAAVATVDAGGDVTGTGLGTVIISYSVTNSCGTATDTQLVTISSTPNPGTITGPVSMCETDTFTFTNTITGGTWAVTNTSASINSSGLVTALMAGIDTIIYTITNSCGTAFTTHTITIKTMPAPIAGGGGTICYNDPPVVLGASTTGGTWSSTSTSVATVDGSGNVYNTGPGTVTISYSLASGCAATTTITINPLPAPIVGTTTICQGSTTTLTDPTGAGSWNTSNASVASIDNGGILYGITPGTATVTYTLTTGCYITAGVSIVTIPPAIAGATSVCTGASTALTNSTGGGSWSSSDTSIAAINASGIVTGVSAGSATITYANGGCYITMSMTVDPLPATITGTFSVCEGATVSVSDATSGGSWSSSNISIATISTGGTVTGVSAGSATISYTSSDGCSVTAAFTVNPIPQPISGTLQVCVNAVTALADATTGGTWSSSNTAIATVSSAGVVTGVVAGTVTITYTRASCFNTASLVVHPLPTSTITPIGDTTMCTGGFVVLAAASATGYTYQWYTGATAISGGTDDYTVAYATAGASSATYQVLITSSFGCSMLSAPINISTNPAVASITYSGATTFCTGSSLTLNANTGTGLTYQWMLSGAAISGATTTSLIAGSSGAYHVVVTNATGCIASAAPVTLTALPVPDNTLNVTGSLTFCAGDSVHLGAVSASGVTYQWQDGGIDITGATGSSYTATATGNYRVVLTNSYPCSSASAIATVTTLPLPATAIAVSGSTTFCTGSTVGLSVTSVAGNTYQWYRNSAAIPGATSATYPASLSGNYTVRVISAAGCTQITPTPVVLSELTDPVVRPLTPLSHCWGGNTVLAIVGSTSGLTFQWYRNGIAVAGGTNSTFNARPSGYYAVSVYYSSGGCTANSAWVSVTEYPLPNPVVSWTGTQLRTGNFYATYQWFRNMTSIPGATTHTIVPFGTATYEVLVTDSNGCQSMSTGFPFPVLDGTITDTAGSGGSGGSGTGGTTGIAVTTAADILIFPNPTRNVIYISAPIALRAELHAMDGRKILEQQNAHEINLTDIAGGMYTLMLFNREGTMIRVEKVVKE